MTVPAVAGSSNTFAQGPRADEEGRLAYPAELLYEHFSGTCRAMQTLQGLARSHWFRVRWFSSARKRERRKKIK
jgi:hypothetical protein